MLDSLRNLKTSRIEFRERLPELECDWLVGQLCARQDIVSADCTRDARRLTVRYDADALNAADLVDLLGACGVRVMAVEGDRF